MTGWVRSTFCAAGDCIEARASVNRSMIWLRRYGEPGELWQVPMTRAEFAAFIAGVKAGDFDHLEEAPC